MKVANQTFSHSVFDNEKLEEKLSLKSNEKSDRMILAIENEILVSTIPIFQLPVAQNVLVPNISTAEEFYLPTVSENESLSSGRSL